MRRPNPSPRRGEELSRYPLPGEGDDAGSDRSPPGVVQPSTQTEPSPKHVPTIAPPHDDIVSRCSGALTKGQVGDKYAEGLARLKRLAETGAASP